MSYPFISLFEQISIAKSTQSCLTKGLPVSNFGNSALWAGDVSYTAMQYRACGLSLAFSAPLHSHCMIQKHDRHSSKSAILGQTGYRNNSTKYDFR